MVFYQFIVEHLFSRVGCELQSGFYSSRKEDALLMFDLIHESKSI
jgi:hypothetical protein